MKIEFRSLGYKGRGRPRKADYKLAPEGHLQSALNADALSQGFKRLEDFYAQHTKNIFGKTSKG